MTNREKKFDSDQIEEINAGANMGLDVSWYAKKEFMAIQMRQIRLGLEESLDVSVYARPEYDWFQMEEIRLGMLDGVDYKVYANPSIDYEKMRQIRKGLCEGVDLSGYIELDAGILRELRKAIAAKVSILNYIKEGYDKDQLREIRLALEKGLPIDAYLNRDFRGIVIREICQGLEDGIDPAIYASIDYDWRQMREIRLGLKHQIDVSLYVNSLFSSSQMREMRLGLEQGVDISPYHSFVYEAADMRKMRERLSKGVLEEVLTSKPVRENISQKIEVFISNDEMEAYINVRCGREDNVDNHEIMMQLKNYGIKYGILTKNINRLVEEKKYNQTILAARGKQPVKGKDGWYEYFFQTHIDRKPEVLPDGSVDYANIKWFEQVAEGQKIALYHGAEYGTAGYTVTGRFISSQKGKEKSILSGKGFQILPDGKTYVSCFSGKIELLAETRIEISRLYVLDEVTLATGNVNVDGSVLVRGDVRRGTVIHATEDVIINGFVEAAQISCEGEIVIRLGADGNGSGFLKAGKKVAGQFFEYIKVESEGDIEANYCLDCDLYAKEWIRIHGMKGMLAGGTARAGRGVEAHNVGTGKGLPTVLKLGISDTLFQKKYDIEKRIREVSKELEILIHAYLDFQKKFLPEVRNAMDIYLKVEKAIYTKKLEYEDLKSRLEQCENEMQNLLGAKAVVKGCLYEGTTIYIENVKLSAYSVKGVVVSRVRDKIVLQPT